MQFLVIGKDGKDEKALERRMAAREAHLKLGDTMEASGDRWYGCVMLNDSGKMIGSMAVMDFPSEKELRKWLDKEPYVKGEVWKTNKTKSTNAMSKDLGSLTVPDLSSNPERNNIY